MASQRRNISECLHEGCDRDSVERCVYCPIHVGDRHRCSRVITETGEQCKKVALLGQRWCRSHGGTPAKSAMIVETTRMQQFVKPFEGDIDPITVFEAEFRRTLGRIAWYDEQLAALKSEKDLIWGLSKQEKISAGEFPGVNKTYEAKANMYLELQNWERKHLLDMEKVWIAAKLDTEKLSLMKRYVEATYSKVIKAIEALGLDPGDAKVREVLAKVLLDEEPVVPEVLAIEGGQP